MVYVFQFVNSVVFTISMLCEIALTYDRLTIFKQNSKYYMKMKFKYSFLAILIYSVLIMIPRLFSQTVEKVPIPFVDIYYPKTTTFGSSWFYKYYLVAINLQSSIFWMSILLILNLMVLIEFRNYKKQRTLIIGTVRYLTDTSRNKRNFTTNEALTITTREKKNDSNGINNELNVSKDSKMKEDSEKMLAFSILCCCSIYAFNRTLLSIGDICTQIDSLNNVTDRPFTTIINYFARLICYLVFAMNLFILMLFNKGFKHHLKNIMLNLYHKVFRH
jgi:hypothetical protein